MRANDDAGKRHRVTFIGRSSKQRSVPVKSSISKRDGSKTPYEIWMGKKPDLKHVQAFGFEHVPQQFAQKFDAKAKRVLLVGYGGE